jgi:hypothetical protein
MLIIGSLAPACPLTCPPKSEGRRRVKVAHVETVYKPLCPEKILIHACPPEVDPLSADKLATQIITTKKSPHPYIMSEGCL